MMNSMPEEQLAAMMGAAGVPGADAASIKMMKQQAATMTPEQLEMAAKFAASTAGATSSSSGSSSGTSTAAAGSTSTSSSSSSGVGQRLPGGMDPQQLQKAAEVMKSNPQMMQQVGTAFECPDVIDMHRRSGWVLSLFIQLGVNVKHCGTPVTWPASNGALVL